MRTPKALFRTAAAVVTGLVIILCLTLGMWRTVNAQGTSGGGSSSGWLQYTVGPRGSVVGSAEVSGSGTYIVTASGADIWRGTDEFHYVYQPLNGDGQIVTRVAGFAATNVFAKAGLMVRETLAADSRNAMMLVTYGKGAFFQWRNKTGEGSEQTEGNTNAAAPYWIKIVRSGDWVGGYGSADGSQWTLVDWVTLDQLAAEVYVGLAVSSHWGGRECTAQFDQVTLGAANPAEVLHPLVGAGDGLRGTFYSNRHLYGPAATNRVTPLVNFDFPWEVRRNRQITNRTEFERSCIDVVGVPRTEQFGIRWIAEVQAQFTEPYTFWVESDDGLRLWLDERLVIDRWHAGGEENSATVEMVAGQKYLLRLEYAQNRGKAFARLRWSSPSTPKRVIPQSQLYSQPTDADGDGMPDLWERAYGLNPNDAGDTAMDPDGDGFRNLQEYRRGSDPTSPLHWGVPNDWATGDIEQWSGSKGNSARFNGGTFTVTSAGEDIWRRMDSFRFVYRPLEGDGEIVARVTGMTGTNGYAKAGVMVRETLDPDARNAMMLVTRSKGNFFQWRPAVWSECVQTAESTNTMTPHWVKIVRCGGWVGGYSSADGVNWKLVEWATFGGLPQRVFVGLAVSAGNKIGTPCEAVFDQVSVGAGNPAEMMHPVVGAGDGLVGSYFNNRNLAGAPVTNRLDSDIDFQWGTRGPLPGVGPDRFGVVWTGELQAQLTELYTLNIVSDDGARLWLNEELLLDTWAGAGTRRASTNVNMVAGQRYLLRLEYNDELSAARVGLRWSSPSTSLRLIPQSQLYSRVTDTDGDGMPDFWEIAHGLNANDANDAALDADGDGLTNLEEYRRRTNPRKGDSDDDGISDVWEIAHGLNASFNDASEDADADGLSNLREFQLQTDPYGWDSDGDGLPDLIEAEYLGTDPNVVNSGVLTEAAAANGAEGTILIGEWQADGTALCGMNRRGEVEYTLTTTNADKFLLKLEGGQRRPRSSQDRFNLRFSVDGESLGYHTLIGGYGTNGAVECLTPYLTAGTHKVRVLWDDAASFSGLRIERLALLSLSGSDTNLNGVRDWVEKAVRTESGIDTNTALTSIESPACVEGRDPYRSMMDLRAGRIGEMTNVVIRRNAGRRWFANVPLLSGEGTRVRGAFQNGALAEAVRIQWQPVNVLVSSNLTIRRGSSLLLTAQPTNVISGTMTITIGTNQISGPAAQPQPFEFSQAGVYTVTGTFTPLSGPPQSRTISVTVVGHRFPNDPACWVGQPREWRVPSVAQGVFIEVDPRIRSEQEDTQSGGGKILSLLADQNEPRYVVSRLGTGGPILDVARAECFRFWAARDTHLQVIETFEDGSQIAEMLLVQSPVASDVIIRLNVIVGGVIFEDGTTQRELTAADFDALGICRVRFIRPATSKTSVCHSITVLQGAALVGRIQ